MNIDDNPKKKHLPQQRRRKLLLVPVSVLIALAIIEVGLRIAGYSYPEFYGADTRRGYSLRPGMEGWYRKEGQAYIRINSDGLRDREHAKAKPPNTLRIAVLGDSFTEALQLPFEESFCAVLEQKLSECTTLGGRSVEVINFGVSGYGTAQELITLRNNVWQYSPDIVMLAVTTDNDISDNVPALKKTSQIPYFAWRGGRLVEDDSFLQTTSFRSRNSALSGIGLWFRDRLRFVQTIIQTYHGLKISIAAHRQKSAPTASGAQGARALSEGLGIDNLVYREPADPIWKDAWSVTEELIKIMRDEVSSRSATFFVMTLSNPPQLLPDRSARDSFLRRVGARDIFYPDNRISDFCRREDIPVVTLAPAMQKYAEEQKVMLHGFGSETGNGHWNAAGHRVAGELAARELCTWLRTSAR